MADSPASRRPGYGIIAASFLTTALLLAGVVSWFASTSPEGLEWCYQSRRYEKVEQNVRNESPVVVAIDRWQKKWSPMSDYTKRAAPLGALPNESKLSVAAWPHVDGWGSLAGVLGTAITLGLLYGVSRLIPKTSHD